MTSATASSFAVPEWPLPDAPFPLADRAPAGGDFEFPFEAVDAELPPTGGEVRLGHFLHNRAGHTSIISCQRTSRCSPITGRVFVRHRRKAQSYQFGCENSAVPTGLGYFSCPTQDSAALRPGLTARPPLRGSFFVSHIPLAEIKHSSHANLKAHPFQRPQLNRSLH